MTDPDSQVPNIFKLATRELTQDSFFVWLLLWANQPNGLVNPHLNQTAQDFVRLLIGRDDSYEITKVDARRQWKNIDVWVEVNKEYYICIEDKTNTGAHSNQLANYKKVVEEHCNGRRHIPKFVYLKTGNESAFTLTQIEDKEGYQIVERKTVLQILDSRPVNNDIFNDFRSYLTTLEELTASGTTWKAINTEERAAQGFYLNLQQLIPEPTDWNNVPNPTGGFLGFWYHFVTTEDFALYVQIENRIRNKILVNIKIRNWTPKIETLHQIYAGLNLLAPKYGLELLKPTKYRVGNTSTVATVINAIPSNLEEEIEISRFLKTLKCLQKVLDAYAEQIQNMLRIGN